jgi:hypothetical protein
MVNVLLEQRNIPRETVFVDAEVSRILDGEDAL